MGAGLTVGRREPARSKQERHAERAARRAALQAHKAARRLAREDRCREVEARLAGERAAQEAFAAEAFERYRFTRERVRWMRERVAAAPLLTEREQQTVRALAHLWDAPSSTIAELRRWCGPVSGVRAADYDNVAPELATRLRRGLAVLQKRAGDALFVPEPAALGGFGCVHAGKRFNAETLTFFEALAALQDAAVLAECRTGPRRLVWEIGGGWGGFAYQFKTMCPNVTYLITALPETLLLSAVYLQTLFANARCRFWDGSDPAGLWHDWEGVDFVFAPEAAIPSLQPPHVDLVVDLMALRHMGSARVSAHVERAFALGARYIYSLLPAAALAEESAAVWKRIERCYWIHPIPPRSEADRLAVAGVATAAAGASYAHLIGWRRMRIEGTAEPHA